MPAIFLEFLEKTNKYEERFASTGLIASIQQAQGRSSSSYGGRNMGHPATENSVFQDLAVQRLAHTFQEGIGRNIANLRCIIAQYSLRKATFQSALFTRYRIDIKRMHT